jgi:Asp-tRNA(Asn)/Glu-tRNA(Gln) amidotransferase A subunit family amidase
MSERDWLTAGEQARLVASRLVPPVELVEHALARIDAVNATLNCFCDVWYDDALAAARDATAAVARGDELGPLHGVPVAVKDTTPTAGHRTTLGSFAFEHWVPDHDAAIVRSLRRAGAIVVGKTTTPELAHTLITDSPLLGTSRNPWNPERTPGGSSGGSAAAVAAGCVALAEGSDMGGSVRIPAAWSGVVGLKPSLGRIPMDVLPGLFDTISHHGPLAACVDDARLFLQATQGPDEADIMSIGAPLDLSQPVEADASGLRVALSVDLGCWAVDPAIERAVRAAAAALADRGAVVEEVEVALTPADEDVWILLWGVFMAGYYGDLLDTHRDRMSPRVVELIEDGRRRSAVDVKRTEIARADLWHRVAPVFRDHDVLLCPTMALGPLPAARADRPVPPAVDDGRFHAHDMTGVFNLVSPCPAISVPCGRDGDGMPIGAQLVAGRWRDDVALRAAAALEAAVAPIGRPPI